MDDDGKKEETTKKAKIGITIKKSPNSDRTFESKLLNQEFDNMSIKNKILDIGWVNFVEFHTRYFLMMSKRVWL